MTRRIVRSLLAAVLLTAAAVVTHAQYVPPLASSTFAATAAVSVDNVPDIVVGPGSGIRVARLLSGADGSELAAGYPFGPDFAGGVRVASGDVNGDGIPDHITGTGPGSAHVSVYSGADIALLTSGRPFGGAFAGGVYVAAGDIDHDGRADIIVGQGEGGGALAVFRVDYVPLGVMQPFGAGYTGGVRVAAGDVTGDGIDDIIAAQATGGLVSIIDGATRTALISAPPFGGPVPGGIYVATGDITGDDVDEVIVSPGSGSGPVLLFDVRGGRALGSFTAYDAGFAGGVRVTAADLNGDHRAEIITAPGPGGQPLLRVFDGATLAPTASVLAYDAGFTGGVYVASIDVPSPPKFTSATATTFQAGEAGTFTVTTDGRPAVTSVTSTGTLPEGVTFTDRGDGTATLAGTPSQGTSGAFPLTLTATNRFGATVTQSFMLTVESRCPALTVVPSTLPDAVAGVPWSTQFQLQGAAELLDWGARGDIPPGFAFSMETGLMSGTPTADTVGTHTFVVVARTTDFCFGSVTVTLTITAAPPNNPPTAAETIAYDTTGNTQLHVAGATRPGVAARTDEVSILAKSGATDADGPMPLTVVPRTDAPTAHGGVVTMAANGSFSYVPAAGFAGTDFFVAQIADAQHSVPVLVNVVVGPRVWYVNNHVDADNPAGGDGRSTDAFETLTAAEAASAENDYIFVFAGETATTPLDHGITLKNGQKLIGEYDGLRIGAATVVPPGSSRPRILGATGSLVTVLADESVGDRTGIAVRGLDLEVSTQTQAAVFVVALDSARLGIDVSNNRMSGPEPGAMGFGLWVASESTTASSLRVADNIMTRLQTGILISNEDAAMTITSFANNQVMGGVTNGIGVTGATFDATPGGVFEVVNGGNTTIGTVAEPTSFGLVLARVSGALSFSTLNVAASVPTATPTDALAAIAVNGTGPFIGTAGMAFNATATVSAVGVTGIRLENLTAGVQASVTASGGGWGLRFDQIAGMVSVAGGSINEVLTAAVEITGGTANVTVAVPIVDTVGRLVAVSGKRGGTVTFTGQITDGLDWSGGGILLADNAGATVTFAGGLEVSTDSGDAFTAINGGIVNVCDDNPCAPGTGPLINTISSRMGTGLNVSDVTIGANNLEFTSISAAGTGTGAGIRVANTGTLGGLQVKSTGRPATGGIIHDKAIAVSLHNTRNVVLNQMILRDSRSYAIDGQDVNGFVLRDSFVDGVNGTDDTTGSVRFRQLTGSAMFERTSISGGWGNNVHVVNTAGDLDRLMFSFVTVRNGTGGNPGIHGIVVESGSSGTTNVTVSDSNVLSARGYLFQMNLHGSGTGDLVFERNYLSNDHPEPAFTGNMRVVVADSVAMTYSIDSNQFNDAFGPALEVSKMAGSGTLTGAILDNRIGTTGEPNSGSRGSTSALMVTNRGAGVHTATIDDNTIRQHAGAGIEVLTGFPGSSATGALNVSINGNTVTEPGANATNGLVLRAGTTAGDTSAVCADIGNVVSNLLIDSGPEEDVVLGLVGNATFRLPGYPGAPTNTTAIRDWLLTRNAFVASRIDFLGTNGITGGLGRCAQ